jgi:hypothetical protein
VKLCRSRAAQETRPKEKSAPTPRVFDTPWFVSNTKTGVGPPTNQLLIEDPPYDICPGQISCPQGCKTDTLPPSPEPMSIPVNTIVGVGLTKSCTLLGAGSAVTTHLGIQPVTSAPAASLASLPTASPLLATVSTVPDLPAAPVFLSVPNTPVNFLRNDDRVNLWSLSIAAQPYTLAVVGSTVVWLAASEPAQVAPQWRIYQLGQPSGAAVPTSAPLSLIHVGSGLALQATSSGSFVLGPPPPSPSPCQTFVQFTSAAVAIQADPAWVLPPWVNVYFSNWQQAVQWIPEWLPEPLRPLPPPPGGDRDEGGCIPSAGYRWCPSLGRCIRPWETSCPAPGPGPWPWNPHHHFPPYPPHPYPPRPAPPLPATTCSPGTIFCQSLQACVKATDCFTRDNTVPASFAPPHAMGFGGSGSGSGNLVPPHAMGFGVGGRSSALFRMRDQPLPVSSTRFA